MRRLPPRKTLPRRVAAKLKNESAKAHGRPNAGEYARARWKSVRGMRWFRPVIQGLKAMVGKGEPCMYCDSNESAEVDHFKPMEIFPESAFDWSNLLWVCGICNRYKGSRYPPHNEAGDEILNPTDCDPWQYLFIDDFTGLLSGLWRETTDSQDPRAESTIKIVNLNREALQERRRERIIELKRFAKDTLAGLDNGRLTATEAQQLIEELKWSPIHPDVSDFFLAGPGREVEPFYSLFEKIR